MEVEYWLLIADIVLHGLLWRRAFDSDSGRKKLPLSPEQKKKNQKTMSLRPSCSLTMGILVRWPHLCAKCTVATSFCCFVGWPCLASLSIFCSFWTVLHAAGRDGAASMRMRRRLQDCFPSLGSVLVHPQGHLSARGTIPPDLGPGFLLFLSLSFATHQQQLLPPLHPVHL